MRDLYARDKGIHTVKGVWLSVKQVLFKCVVLINNWLLLYWLFMKAYYSSNQHDDELWFLHQKHADAYMDYYNEEFIINRLSINDKITTNSFND